MGKTTNTVAITSFRIGPNENDIVTVEEVLMKLALAESVMHSLANYADRIAADGGTEEEYNTPPDQWAITGAFQNIMEINRALKAGCWGHEVAFVR